MLKLVVLPSKATHHERATADIAERANELLRTIASVIDDLIGTVIAQRTATDFREVTLQVFPQYYAALRALGDLCRIVLSKETIERLGAEWLCELEADFRDHGPAAFGADLTERGLFTVWTLRKISDLAREVSDSTPLQESTIDIERATDFAAKAVWTRLHVDVLVKAMHGPAIYPDVVDQIRDGLRMAVDTYASVREWLDLRNPKPDVEVGPIEWTDEDEALVLDSMRDLDHHRLA